MMNDKDNPGALPGQGITKDRAAKASSKKAGFPGGKENAAGADGTKKRKRTKIGSPPVSSDSLDFGDQKNKK